MVYKENNNPEDMQNLGLFGRFGYANSDLNEIGNFWSLGTQYQGLIDGRDDDVLGLRLQMTFYTRLEKTLFTVPHCQADA